MGSGLYFFFLSGPMKGKIERVEGKAARIGYQAACDVQLDPTGPEVLSQGHAEVLCERKGSESLHDRGSPCGAFKNGQQIHGPVPLNTGDVISCGPSGPMAIGWGLR